MPEIASHQIPTQLATAPRSGRKHTIVSLGEPCQVGRWLLQLQLHTEDPASLRIHAVARRATGQICRFSRIVLSPTQRIRSDGYCSNYQPLECGLWHVRVLSVRDCASTSRAARRKASVTQPPSVNRQERSVQSPPASLRGKRRDMLAVRPSWWVGIASRSQRRDTGDTTGSLEGAGGATPGFSA